MNRETVPKESYNPNIDRDSVPKPEFDSFDAEGNFGGVHGVGFTDDNMREEPLL